MRANNSNFSFKGFEVASHTHSCIPCPKEREQKGTKNVHVLQKLDILFGLNTPRSHSTYYIPPLAASTLITNLFFQKCCNFQKNVKGNYFFWKAKKKKKFFGNIFEYMYNLKIF